MKILLLILLSIDFILQIRFLRMERDTTSLYLCKKLLLGKNYYLTVDCMDDQVILLLVDVFNNSKQKVNNVIEKGFRIYFYCDDAKLVFNTLTKKIQVC